MSEEEYREFVREMFVSTGWLLVKLVAFMGIGFLALLMHWLPPS